MGAAHDRRGIWTFYKDTFPAIFRETFPDTLTAFVLFLVAALAGVLLGLADPSFSRYFLGPAMMQSIEHHKMWTDSIVTIKPLASSGIMTNNISVAFAAFAMGITAGIGTVWMMLFNGLMMGVVGVACWREGMSLSLWSFVAAHGVLELPAIFIAGRSWAWESPRDCCFRAVLTASRFTGSSWCKKRAPGARDDPACS